MSIEIRLKSSAGFNNYKVIGNHSKTTFSVVMGVETILQWVESEFKTSRENEWKLPFPEY